MKTLETDTLKTEPEINENYDTTTRNTMLETKDNKEDNNNNKNESIKGKIALICGILIQLTLGLQYIVGNLIAYFASYMASKNGNTIELYNKYLNDLTYLYTAHTIFGNAFVVIGAKLEVKFKPRITMIIGVILTEIGLFLSYFTIHNFWGLLFTLGMIAGIGIGICYPIPMLVGMRWFPNHKGLVSGLIVAGYGFSGMIFNPLSTLLINPNNDKISSEHGFLYNENVLNNVPKLFIYMGLITSSMLIIGIIGLFSTQNININDETKTKQNIDNDADNTDNIDINNKQENYKIICKCIKIKEPELTFVKQYKFWNLIFTYLLGSMITTYIATQWKDIGNRWFGIENDRLLSLMGLVGSLCNGLSRVLWGFLKDIIKSYKKTMLLLMFILTSFMFTFMFLKYINNYDILVVFSFIWIGMQFLMVTGQYGIFPSFYANEYGNSDGMIAYGYAQFVGLVSPFIVTAYYLFLRKQFGWIAMNIGVTIINIIMIILIFAQPTTNINQSNQSNMSIVDDNDIEDDQNNHSSD